MSGAAVLIKYHGTPVGGTKFDALRFLSGRHALVSYIAQTHLPEVLECCESFCLDNGAFTIWKQGGQLDLIGYRNWVDKLSNHPAMDFYLIPDVIGGGEEQNDTLLKDWHKDFTGVPVFHLGENPDRFLRLAGEYGHVALGSTDSWGRNGTEKWWFFMADFLDTVTKDGLFPCKVHGLRMLDPRIFKYVPLHSGDSTNAAVNGHLCMKKGTHPAIERWQGNERIAQRIEHWQSAQFWDRTQLVSDGVINE